MKLTQLIHACIIKINGIQIYVTYKKLYLESLSNFFAKFCTNILQLKTFFSRIAYFGI